MVTYALEFTGPVGFEWYKDRGLTSTVSCKGRSGWMASMIRSKLGEDYEIEEITEHFAGGQMIIKGASVAPVQVPIMDQAAWNHFSSWLSKIKTESLMDLGGLIDRFQSETGRTIRWGDDLEVVEQSV